MEVLRDDLTQNKESDGATVAPARQFVPGKWLATGLSMVMICAALSPLKENWSAKPKDDFPLSYFPMFTDERGETYKVTHMVGLAGGEKRHKIRHIYAGDGGFNQVRRQIRKIVREGSPADLCRSVAARVARIKRGPLAEVNQVQVVTGEYHLNNFFAGNKNPVSEKVHAVCDVERSRR